MEAGTPDASSRPIRIGARVTSTNAAPTFASDPQPGDRGTVQQSAGTSYLVRWDGGAESWVTRDLLEPSGRGSLAPAPPSGATTVGTTTAGPATAASPPTRAPGPARGPAARNFQRFLPLLFVLFAAQGLLRALWRSARHPGANTVLLALLAVAIVALIVRRALRPRGPSRGPRPPGAPGAS